MYGREFSPVSLHVNNKEILRKEKMLFGESIPESIGLDL
jgi:hypothetical protein